MAATAADMSGSLAISWSKYFKISENINKPFKLDNWHDKTKM